MVNVERDREREKKQDLNNNNLLRMKILNVVTVR